MRELPRDLVTILRTEARIDAEAQLAERAGGVNEDALRALAQAYDREDSAQRGEPDPWNLDDPGDIGDSDTWVSERLACARAAAEAFLSALSRTGAVKVKPLEWEETHTRRSDEDPTTEWNGGFEAESALGFYEISMGFGSDAYYWAVTNPLGDDVGSDFEDPSYAKAAAQADYERRILSALEATPPASEGRHDDEPLAYIVHAPEDDYYGIGPESLQFHPLAQHDLDRGYRQTPLYARPAPELTGNTGELIDKMAEAIRGDTVSDDTPWATLSEDRKIAWRGDAERALAVVKEYLTALDIPRRREVA